MIEHVTGNLLEADTEALVNTVNTVGVMGKGIALQFRQAYPENYQAYRKACHQGEVQPGRMFIFTTGKLTNPRYLINFPTKRHWKGKTKIQDVRDGLRALIAEVKERDIKSIAIPPLGCGNGGLDWNEVREMIEAAFEELPGVRVLLFAPDGAPGAGKMRIATKRPNMTRGRAALLGVLENYQLPGYRLSMLEVQKLAYFLQAAGEPLKLNYVKDRYGPYAENVHHVLQRLDGHFITGYGDRTQAAAGNSISLQPEAVAEAAKFLEHQPETLHRLQRVTQLIEGFETPFGLELLATVHWAASENPAARVDAKAAVGEVQAWSERKRKAFSAETIGIAWHRLNEGAWFADEFSSEVPHIVR